MSQLRNTPNQSPWGQRSLLRRLSYLSGVGLLSSGAAIAQTPSSTPQIVISSPAPTVSPTISASPTTSELDADLSLEQPIAREFSPKSEPAPLRSAPLPVEPTPQSPADYEAPTTIVFSDRSSGCEFALTQGQAISTACGGETVTASPRSTASIASTGYAAVQPDSAPIQIREAAFSRSGRVTPSNSTPLPASAFIKNYYNRSVRPLGLPGNNNVRLLFPLSIPSVITSVFGWRVHPISGNQRFHSGTDLGAPMGTPVLAALTGRVLLADFFGGYGLAIALEHSQGTQQTLYAHLSEIFVKPGEVIKQGTVIGRVGSTGNSTGPHLHFEFRQLTTQGWVAQDAGTQLESALAQLAQSLQTAQKIPAQPGNSKS